MLQSNLVFIDTQVFVSLGFNVKNDYFKKIEELGRNGEISLITTTITINEIESNIRKRLQEELSTLSKIKTARQIQSVRDAITSMPSIESAVSLLIKELKEFIDKSKTTILKIDGSIAEDVFIKYFNNQPPFGAGKKKLEFPDAFALGTIVKYIADQKCYVISGDGDHISACIDGDKFIGIEKIEYFLNLYNEHQEEQIEKIKDWINDNESTIKINLHEAIGDYSFTCDDSDDGLQRDYDIYDFKLLNINITDINIIDISAECATASLEIDVSLTVKYTFNSYECAIYDREDGQYFGVEDEESSSEIDISLSCSVFLLLEDNAIEFAHITIDNLDAFDVSSML